VCGGGSAAGFVAIVGFDLGCLILVQIVAFEDDSPDMIAVVDWVAVGDAEKRDKLQMIFPKSIGHSWLHLAIFHVQ
jgi:hypothetical protein